MEIPLPTEDENERLAALNRYEILDTDFEDTFDDLAKVASHLCETPIALISLIDPERQWFKAVCGLGVRETSRDVAFCAHAIHGRDVLIVPDTLNDPRFHDNPLVSGDPKIRFYAGAPLVTNDGYALGTLCTIDREPRELNDMQIEGLKALARQVCVNLDLRLRTRALASMNESKNRLFSIIAHDMRSPLYALNTIAEKLDDEADDMNEEERRTWLRHARKSAATTLSVAENLLKWANFEEGKFNFEPVEIDLAQFLEEMIPVLESNARKKSIQMSISTTPSLMVYADPTMLHSIVQNLVSNAVKFTPEKGNISISLAANRDCASVEVSDTGTGIPDDVLKNLFDIEKTYSMAGTDGEKGSGLGLHLCRQFAEEMNGSITLESNPEVGATARLALPLISSGQ